MIKQKEEKRMGKISAVNSTSLTPLLDKVKEKTKGSKTLEEAAQVTTDVLWETASAQPDLCH
jgi:hypothetical protein